MLRRRALLLMIVGAITVSATTFSQQEIPAYE
jgi:hypothetical protein